MDVSLKAALNELQYHIKSKTEYLYEIPSEVK